jgi:hypothetical protein
LVLPLLAAAVETGPDFEAFWSGFQIVAYVAIAVVVAFMGIGFIRKQFGE